MPAITALLHTSNDALRLGRALETLLPCAEILVADHHSSDRTCHVATRFGAKSVQVDDHDIASCLGLAAHNWILCLRPSESITDSLQATLFEWSLLPEHIIPISRSFRIGIRRQEGEVWQMQSALETRLVHRTWNRWKGNLPTDDPSSIALEGELLRLDSP